MRLWNFSYFSLSPTTSFHTDYPLYDSIYNRHSCSNFSGLCSNSIIAFISSLVLYGILLLFSIIFFKTSFTVFYLNYQPFTNTLPITLQPTNHDVFFFIFVNDFKTYFLIHTNRIICLLHRKGCLLITFIL